MTRCVVRTWEPRRFQISDLRLLIVTLAVRRCLAACASSDPANETVTIGFTGPLSGGAALYGRNVLDGLEMAIADINDAGGIKIGGRQVKVAVAPLDDRYFPNESATNAKRLVHQYGAPIVFCPHSGGILAIQGFNALVAALHRRRLQQRAADRRERQPADADDSAEVHHLLRRLRRHDDRAPRQAARPHSRRARLRQGMDEGFLGSVDEQGRHAADQQRDRLQHHHGFFERRQQGAVGEAGRAVRRRAVAGHRARDQGGAGSRASRAASS